MTIDSAIAHAMDKYKECLTSKPACALDHFQLATWLAELVAAREENKRLRKMLRVYSVLLPFCSFVGLACVVFIILKHRGVL